MNTHRALWPVATRELGERTRASALLEATSLARALSTLRVGVRGFFAGTSPNYGDIGFYNSTTIDTSRSAVRISSDRLKRKIALVTGDVPTPASRQFRYGEVDQVVEYARTFHHGIVLKPRDIDGKVPVHTPLHDPETIRAAVEQLEVLTGRRTAYLAEQWIRGTEFHCHVVGDNVVSITSPEANATHTEIYRMDKPALNVVPARLLELAMSAVNALPAMPHGVAVIKATGTGRNLKGVVVSITPRLQLLGDQVSNAWSLFLADQMVSHAGRNTQKIAETAHVDAMDVAFSMHDVPEPKLMRDGLLRWADRVGVKASADIQAREVRGTARGNAGELAAMSCLAKSGKFGGVRPQTVTLDQMNTEPLV